MEAEEIRADNLERSLTKAAFHRKKLALQSKVGYIQKDKENPHFRYKYVSAEAVLKAVNPAMLETRMSSEPHFSIISEKWLERVNKAPEHIVIVQCSLLLTDEETGWTELAAIALGGGQDTGDKAVMKAQTAALKYAWTTALNVPTGDDPEADAGPDERAEPATPGAQTTKTYTPTRQAPAPAAASVSAGVPPPAVSVSSPAPEEAPASPLPEAWKPPPTEQAPAPVAGTTGLSRTQGKVIDFQIKNGKYRDKPGQWSRYDVTLDDKLIYSTFDAKEGDKASMFASNGDTVLVFWSLDKSGRYRNLEAIDAV